MRILRSLILTLVTLIFVTESQAAMYYFHTDHLGTPQVVTDKDQTVVWQGEYSPFGEVTETTRAVEQNLRFPGQYFDAETKLHYNYFRDYDPESGRYVQSDPIGLIGGLNTYSYVGNNSLIYADPYGLFDVKKFFAKTAVTMIVNAAVGAKVLGLGSLTHSGGLGCSDFTSDCDGDGIPDNKRAEDDSDAGQCK